MNKSLIFVSILVVFVILLLQLEVSAQSVNENEISDRNVGVSYRGHGDQPQGRSWMESTQKALASPTGQLAINMAKELINRSTGNSQVS